jgi:hypothetical protein
MRTLEVPPHWRVDVHIPQPGTSSFRDQNVIYQQDSGSNQPACSKALAEKMVEGGWLVKQGERYQPTEKGWHAGEAGPHVG